MSSTPNVVAEAGSRLMIAIAIGAFSTAAAGAGTAIVLTGSASPAAWVAAYQHSHECALDSAAQDPNCSAAAAQSSAQRQLAAQLEQQASQLKANPTAAASPPGPEGGPDAGTPAADTPAAAPVAPAQMAYSDDSGEGDDG